MTSFVSVSYWPSIDDQSEPRTTWFAAMEPSAPESHAKSMTSGTARRTPVGRRPPEPPVFVPPALLLLDADILLLDPFLGVCVFTVHVSVQTCSKRRYATGRLRPTPTTSRSSTGMWARASTAPVRLGT